MPLKIEGPLLCSSVTSRLSMRYNEHLINDWSLGKQLILFPENLKVSRGGALTMHLYEKPGNSGENSNEFNGSSRRKFCWKKVILFEVLPFSRFYRNDRNFLHHLFGSLVPGFMSRESEKFTCIL